MKAGGIGILFLAMLTAVATVSAKTVYVNDMVKLMLRTGRGLENRIVAVVESGDPVEMLEEGNQWSLVRTRDGKQGWVLSRYLTENETASIRLDRLQAAQETGADENALLSAETQRLKDENRALSEALERRGAECDRIEKDYATLKEESADFLSLKSDFTAAGAQLAEAREQNRHLGATLDRLKRERDIRWFIAGAAVLLVGYLAGAIARKKRRKPSLL